MAKKKKKKGGGSSLFATTATFGSGVVLGVLVAPYVKDAMKKYTPILDEAIDQFSAKASDVFERGTDILAQAKEQLRSQNEKKA